MINLTFNKDSDTYKQVTHLTKGLFERDLFPYLNLLNSDIQIDYANMLEEIFIEHNDSSSSTVLGKIKDVIRDSSQLVKSKTLGLRLKTEAEEWVESLLILPEILQEFYKSYSIIYKLLDFSLNKDNPSESFFIESYKDLARGLKEKCIKYTECASIAAASLSLDQLYDFMSK